MQTSKRAEELLAGSAAGVSQAMVGQPFDTVKVRLQNVGGRRSVRQVATDLMASEGVRGLYRGTSCAVAAGVAANAVTFGAYGAMRRMLLGAAAARRPRDSDSFTTVAACGAAGGAATGLVNGPIELIRIRMQTATERPRSVARFVAALIAREGLTVLARGLGWTILRDTPAYAICFTVYEATGRRLSAVAGSGDALWTRFVAGALAGAVMWGVVYPLDVAKTRVQAGAMLQAGCDRRLFAGCYRGFGVCLARAAPVNAAILATYEATTRWFRREESGTISPPP